MIRLKQFLSEKSSKSIFVADIDDCLVFTTSKIYYTEPGQKEKSVGTDEFAKIRTKLDPKTEYDFRDFRQFGSIYSGITRGEPNIKVLKMLDKAIHDGKKIGMITARGNQPAVYKAITDWLLYRDKDGELKKIPKSILQKKFVFAVSDEKTAKALGVEGGPSNPQDLKAYVLQTIFGDRMGFTDIQFVDDDVRNVAAVNDLKDKRIKGILV